MRRNFTTADQVAIVKRATDPEGLIHCEKCRAWAPKRGDYEIDHVIPEGMRPLADLARKLTPADGQLLCLPCHDAKTDGDKGAIAKAKRMEAKAFSLRKGRKEPKPKLTKIATGKPRIAREYGL